MKIRFVLFILFLNGLTIGQSSPATAKRAKNGKLISLTNLSELKDCGVKIVEGKVRGVWVEGETVYFDMGKKRQKENVRVDYERLNIEDRRSILKELVKEGLVLRVSGYTCGTDGMIEAISIDRSY